MNTKTMQHAARLMRQADDTIFVAALVIDSADHQQSATLLKLLGAACLALQEAKAVLSRS